MVHKSTVDTFKKMYDLDRLSTAMNLNTWTAAGRQTIEERAWQSARQLISDHEYELEESKKSEVERIYARAVKYLAG